jgi:hypothetical protein
LDGLATGFAEAYKNELPSCQAPRPAQSEWYTCVESLCRRGLALERISRSRTATIRDILLYLDGLPADFDFQRQTQIESECTSLVESSEGLLPPPALCSPRSEGSAASLAGTVVESNSPRGSTVVGSCVSLLADTFLSSVEDLAPTEILAPSSSATRFQVGDRPLPPLQGLQGVVQKPPSFKSPPAGVRKPPPPPGAIRRFWDRTLRRLW